MSFQSDLAKKSEKQILLVLRLTCYIENPAAIITAFSEFIKSPNIPKNYQIKCKLSMPLGTLREQSYCDY